MRIRLTKWGNSLGIRLPKIFAMHMGMEEGSEVEMEIHDDTILLSKPKESLEKMLERITPEMLHEETDMADAVGNEVW